MRPIFRAFVDEVERRGGEDVLLEMIARGLPILQIMRAFGANSRRMFYDYINQTDQRKRKYKAAQKLGAEALVEQAKRMMERTDERLARSNNEHAIVSHTKNHADFTMKLAAILDPETYGQKAQPAGALSASDLGKAFVEVMRAGADIQRQVTEGAKRVEVTHIVRDGGDSEPSKALVVTKEATVDQS